MRPTILVIALALGSLPAPAQLDDILKKADDALNHRDISSLSDDKIIAGLKQALELRWATTKTQQDIREMERQLKVLTDDQARLRANLREVPSESEIGKRYLTKLNEQETIIEKYQADVKKLQTAEHNQRKEFEQFLAGFSAE